MNTEFDLKAASCVPSLTLLACLGTLYMLDAAVIHIPFYEDFELIVFSALLTLIGSLYSVNAHSQSHYFVAAALNGLTAFFILRSLFVYQQFVNRCDPLGDICAFSIAFRFPTTVAFFLTLVPCAGLYGSATYVFMRVKACQPSELSPATSAISPVAGTVVQVIDCPAVVVGQPAKSSPEAPV